MSHPTARVNASLALRFEYDAARRTAALQSSSQEPPLKVVRAFSLKDGSALVHLHNVSGGLLGGDQLKMTLEIGESAHVQITTTGATRVYRSRAGAGAATQRIDVSVGQNACLEYLPDPIIPFADSRFAQHTRDPSRFRCWPVLVGTSRSRSGGLRRTVCLRCRRNENQHFGVRQSDCNRTRSRCARDLIRSPPRPDSASIATGPPFTFAASEWKPGEWLALEQQLREVAHELFSDRRHALGHQHAASPRHRLPMLGCLRTRRPRLSSQTLARREICAVRHRSDSTAKSKLTLRS